MTWTMIMIINTTKSSPTRVKTTSTIIIKSQAQTNQLTLLKTTSMTMTTRQKKKWTILSRSTSANTTLTMSLIRMNALHSATFKSVRLAIGAQLLTALTHALILHSASKNTTTLIGNTLMWIAQPVS